MSLPSKSFELVRLRAGFSCEYCGVMETDCAGPLTVDHHQPRSRGGSDDLENLVYCCHRCNTLKSDYWPATLEQLPLWNPRAESSGTHLLLLHDGTLAPLTKIGSTTLAILALNRPQLVAYRVRRRNAIQTRELIQRYEGLLSIQEQLQLQAARALAEQRELLETLKQLQGRRHMPEQTE